MSIGIFFRILARFMHAQVRLMVFDDILTNDKALTLFALNSAQEFSLPFFKFLVFKLAI